MELQDLLVLIIGNWALIIPLFLWNRAESRADIRHMDAKLEENRRETNQILQGIQQEMKDFHIKLALQDQEFKNRICKIEERNKEHRNG